MRSRSKIRPLRIASRAVVLAAILSLSALPARAADTAFQPAPIWGADVRALAFSPEDSGVVLAGTSAGQLYLSRNAGATWQNAGAALPFPGWVVGALRFDPNRSGRLWAALWGIWGSGQVAFSDDLGKSWAAASQGLPNEPVYTLALVPGRPGRLYAGTRSGVWGTEDGGGSWRRLTAELPDVEKVTSLLVDPVLPDTVIAGTWRQAYRSDDGGRTWSKPLDGMVLDTEVFSLTPIPERPGEIWASTCGWVYQTVDHGSHWQRFKQGLDERRTTSFAALPDGRLLAGTVSGLYASIDGGKTWARKSDPALAVLSIAVQPQRPERIVLGTEGSGVWISNDGGEHFHRASQGMTNTRVWALAAAGPELLAAVDHAGPISGIHVSEDGGRTWSGIFAPLPTVLDLAVFKDRPYAATERGLYQRLGQDWHRIPELGEGRIEQLATDGQALVARTATGFWELAGERFVPLPWKHGAPRSAALLAGALWASDEKGVYRLTPGANHTIAAPAPGGRLDRVGDRLLLWSASGAWLRGGGLEGEWSAVAEKPTRVLPTGDARYPAVVVEGEAAKLYDRAARAFRALDVPFPARDIASALVRGGRLFLGTSGYGLQVRDLPAPADEDTEPPPAGG